MTRRESREITRRRLAEFADQLAGNTATPAILLGIGHAPETLGKMVLCTVDDLDGAVLARFLRAAARAIEAGLVDRP